MVVFVSLAFTMALCGRVLTIQPTAIATDELSQRRAFLEARLEVEAQAVQMWWRAWMGIYIIGVAFNGANLPYESNDGLQANSAIGIGKSSLGVLQLLLDADGALRGADAMRAAGPDLAAQVRMGEALLEENARRAERRWHWLPHVINLALNLGGGLFVLLEYDEPVGLAWAALGFAMGEASIWTYPWGAPRDLHDYRRRFGNPRE